MDNVSNTLKEARLAKGLSLEQVEAATSIRKAYLDAVEQGAFDKIPGDVFAKGIIRTYGNYLGLNGPDLVNTYKAEHSGLSKEQVAPQPIRMVEKISVSPQIKPERVSSGNWLSYALVLVLVLAVAGGIAWFMNSGDSEDPAIAVLPGSNVTEQAQPVQAPVYNGVNLHIKCTDRCWVEVTADGSKIFEALMENGQEQTFEAKENMVVLYGNIAAMEITLNGKLLPPEQATAAVEKIYNK